MRLTNLPLTKIGELEFYLIQGGMGVGISRAGLASAVAEEGGAGIIASVGLGAEYFIELLRENEQELRKASSPEAKKEIRNKLYALSNQIALKEEIREARRRTNGVIGVNIMYALSDFPSLFETAINEEADLMLIGAGVVSDIQKYLKGRKPKTKIGAIVTSAKGADFICRTSADLDYPAFFVDEGPMAGGHLGYGRYDPKKPNFTEHLDNPEFVAHGLEKRIKEIVEVARKYETKFGRKIPVIAAGGIFYGGDIKRAREEWKAEGVQMATRLVTTKECDADIKFKQAYLDCKKEDLVIINSPVGMLGRAIKNAFLESVERGKKVPISCPYHCLKTCVPENSPYCIANVLTSALKGNFQSGYVFAGANAWRCKEIISVKELFNKLDEEYLQRKVSD
ncbi:MAG TPA: NAD(P)H-dependent flavin oxidoreductase [Candidatus Wunengus sp. YC63]|uniref:NAD(P)H-dependent flavin oxidoreductase n=1 Tax=Candidatus Wunengus sp. YC63 TaxID=3367699 RepID=UPI0040296C80